jgi:hypothetical protein
MLTYSERENFFLQRCQKFLLQNASFKAENSQKIIIFVEKMGILSFFMKNHNGPRF